MGVNSSTPLSGGPAPHGVKVAVKERYNAYLPDNINRHAVLTEEKVKLVHDHWNFIADERDTGLLDSRSAARQSRISVFYDAFYEKLFEKAPDTRALFEGNMVRQSRALVKMVSWLCNLEVSEELVNRLETLADRHVGYGCLPFHYEAGGVALQYALRATTEDQDVEHTKVIMKAWEDLYTFVILIVIPRTALRLEESIRSAGPVSSMLRSTPISGTRLKAHTTPPRNWHPRGDVGPPHTVIGTPHTVAGTPHTIDGEWFGGGSGRANGSARMPIVRSGSGSFTRSISVRRRSVSHKGGGGGRSSKHVPDAEPLGGSASAGRLGGGHHAAFGGQCRGHDEGYTPGGSPSSVASSMASGLQLSVTGSVATTTGYDSMCASPDGSTVSSGTRHPKGDGRRSKILRGLGKLGVGTGGAGAGGGGSGAASSSPKGSIRSRARAAFGRTRQDGGAEDNGSDIGGKELSSSAGAAAPHLPSTIRRGHSRGSSVRPEVPAAPTAPGGSDPSTNVETPIVQAVEGGSSSRGGGENGSTPASSRASRGSGGHGGRPGRSDIPPPLPSPAQSVVSLPGGPSWDQPSQRGSTGSLSRRLNARTTVAPTSESPSAVFLAPPDFEWGDAAEVDRPRLRRQVGRGEKGADGANRTGVHSSARVGVNDGLGGINRSSTNTRPHDHARSTRRSTPGVVGAGARDTATGTAARTAPPLIEQQQVGAGVAVVDPLQLPASSRARMESVSFNRNGVLGVGKAAIMRRRSNQSGGAGGSERKVGVRDSSERGSAPRVPSASGEGGLHGRHDVAALMEPLELLVLPVTPGVDDTQFGRAQLASPSPTALHSGSRRTGKRASAASRRSHCGGRAPRGDVKAEFEPAGEPDRRDSAENRLADGVHLEVDSSLCPPVRKLSQEAAAMWGFLEDITSADKANWHKRPGNSSGGEVDQIGAHALAYREARQRERLQQRQQRVEGAADKGKGRQEEETNRVLSLMQPRHNHGHQALQKEQIEGLTAIAILPPASRRHADEGKLHSPSPEELAAMEAEASDARQVATGVEHRPRTLPAPASSPLPALLSPLPRLNATGSTPRTMAFSRTGVSALCSPPLCTSPFFAAASSSLPKRSKGDSGGGGGLITGFGGGMVARMDDTPPMWKLRRPIMGSASPAASPPSASNNGKEVTGIGSPPCGNGTRPAMYNTPPASPPPPFSKTSTINAATVEALEETVRRAALGGKLRLVKGGSVADRAGGADSRGGAIAAAMAAAAATRVETLVSADLAATAAAPALAHGGRPLRLAVEPPPDLLCAESRMQLRPTQSQQQQQQSHQQQQQSHQQQQQQLVKKSSNRPMLLPPSDDSEHIPQADHFGGSTPAAVGKKRATATADASEDRVSASSAGAEAASSSATPSDLVSQPSQHGKGNAGKGDRRPLTPGARIGAAHSLPRSIHSLTSLWSGSDLSKDSRDEEEDSDFSCSDGRSSEPHGGETVLATSSRSDPGERRHGVMEALLAEAAAAPAIAGSICALSGQTSFMFAGSSFNASGASSRKATTVEATPGLEHGAGRVNVALERWKGNGRVEAKMMAAAAAAAAQAPAPLPVPSVTLPAKIAVEDVAGVSAIGSRGAPAVAGVPIGKGAAVTRGVASSVGDDPSAASGTATAGSQVGVGTVENTRVNGMVVALNNSSNSSTSSHTCKSEYASTALASSSSSSSGTAPAPSATVAPSSTTVFAAQSGAKQPRGRVAAMAASFTAGKSGRGDVVANGSLHNGGVDEVGVGVGGGQLLTKGDAGTGGRGEEDREKPGAARRKGPIEGLAFGNVRQKASAWGKAWRS